MNLEGATFGIALATLVVAIVVWLFGDNLMARLPRRPDALSVGPFAPSGGEGKWQWHVWISVRNLGKKRRTLSRLELFARPKGEKHSFRLENDRAFPPLLEPFSEFGLASTVMAEKHFGAASWLTITALADVDGRILRKSIRVNREATYVRKTRRHVDRLSGGEIGSAVGNEGLP